MILLIDFNAKSFSVNNTKTEEATVLGNLTSLHGMKQLISAHILYRIPQAALTLLLSTT